MEENFDIFDFSLSDDEMASPDSMQGALGVYWNPVRDGGLDLGETEKYCV